ncbi:MAG TPA: hypothetical protein VKB46_10225 [Pyrinomonadaceae bacterium]|nr:hypothetical protein [Pyrinomonadaceae bacterium]
MPIRKIVAFTSLPILLSFLLASPLLALQKNKTPVVLGPLLTRKSTKHEVRRFGYGGTLTIVGAPKGSITVEGWQRNEVDLTADIELQAESEADLDRLATVNGFAFDEDPIHLSVLTTGTHDRAYMKKVAKNFPKNLLNLPWKIDYKLKVPTSTDIEINGGHGPLNVAGVEGALRINATEGDALLSLTGGSVSVTVAAGNVKLLIPVRSWRGSGAEVRLAAGILSVEMPAGFNGDIDADILRTGKIESTLELESREKPGITEKIVRARAGAGGATFRFTVGDGLISLKKSGE